MSYLSDLLGDSYKEGMTEEEISTALQAAGAGQNNDAEINRLNHLHESEESGSFLWRFYLWCG